MPFVTRQVKAPVFMRYPMGKRKVRIYHVYRRNDADSGVLRNYSFATHPYDGDDDVKNDVTFDVRDLSTWQTPDYPPYMSNVRADPVALRKNRRAWKRFMDRDVERKAIELAIQAALRSGEIKIPEGN